MPHSYDHGGNVFTVARTLGVAPAQVFDFSASINPLGMSSMVHKALICSLDSLAHYPDTSHKELKQALAKYHGLSPTHFTIANGSTELIYNLPAMLPGKKALIISPSFSEYIRALNQHHWDAQHFILTPESNFSIDTDALEAALADGVDVLYICNPSNPSGTLYPQRTIEKIYSLCLSAGTFLVLDEAFMDFCEEASAKRMIVHSDNAIVLRSMTKFFGIPGLRLGYSISNATLAERLDAMGGPWSVNSLALAAGAAALQDVKHNQDTLDFVRQERRRLFESLAQFSRLKLYPSSVNYLLVEIKEGMTSRELKERLLLHRIIIRDCSSFMGLSERFFRIAVRSSDENNRLLECLGRILQ
ncbi:MAG: threonine-phosphate decarboxylase CobD [Desulfuromonadaceae bacterium]|nr:threonine-phosphate decarboxylase CobD [Desulfuromonadaceae bacterium]MDD2847515.1 threonine-phosphate decarboxylase CobD [Desulfuromonadaceae bacterium]MDD4131372.1 threonine-phosphate decarboxylase CobD [Desulfuromonadaceae bacterium]